jgi:hypothetical protein
VGGNKCFCLFEPVGNEETVETTVQTTVETTVESTVEIIVSIGVKANTRCQHLKPTADAST